MTHIRFLSLVLSLTLAAPIPSFAGPAATGPTKFIALQQECMREARWLVLNSSAYRNVDVRRRTQLRNAYNPEVTRLQDICKALTSSSTNKRKTASGACSTLATKKRLRSGVDAAQHADRVDAYCRALSVT